MGDLTERHGHIEKRAPSRVLFTSLFAFCLILLIGLFPSESPGASAQVPVSSPHPFQDDFDARLASNGKRLWLARTGRRGSKGRLHAQVFTYRHGRWARISRRFSVTSDLPLQLEFVRRSGGGGFPCLARSVNRHRTQFRCRQNGQWRVKPIVKSLRKLELAGLATSGNRLVTLFSKWQGFNTSFRVARLEGGKIRPLGPLVTLKGQFVSRLGMSTNTSPKGPIDVSVQDANESGRRWIMTLRGSQWTATDPIANEEEGVALSGPVRTAESVFMPVVVERMGTGTWPFSIFKWSDGLWNQVDGTSISHGEGVAQGGIDPVGNNVWATWSQMMLPKQPLFGGWMPTDEWAARLSKDGSRIVERVRLWSGKAYWPPQTQAVRYRKRPAFLYMRQFKPRGGLHATVRIHRR